MNNTTRYFLSACFLAGVVGLAHAQTAIPAPPPPATSMRPVEAAPPPPDKADERVERLREYSALRRQEALEQARRSAEQLDAEIAGLQQDVQARWQSMGQDARHRMTAAMTDVRTRRTRLAEWYGGMRHASDQAWGEVRTGFVASYRELSDAFARARSQFDDVRQQPADQDPGGEQPSREERR